MGGMGRATPQSCFPEFLEVIQAQEAPVPEWTGVSGAVSLVDVKIAKKIDEMHEKFDADAEKNAATTARVAMVDTKIDAMQRAMKQMSDGMAHFMAQIHGGAGRPCWSLFVRALSAKKTKRKCDD